MQFSILDLKFLSKNSQNSCIHPTSELGKLISASTHAIDFVFGPIPQFTQMNCGICMIKK